MDFKKSEIILEFTGINQQFHFPQKTFLFPTSHETNTESIGVSLPVVLDVYLAFQSSHRSQRKHQM